jgi:CheY-like chemotaxis protein
MNQVMRKVLSVGQCGFDHGSISRQIQTAFGATVEAADTGASALRALRAGGYDLVLVNRVFDADGASGLDLIRELKTDPALGSVPVMLVSNYPDAQGAAEALGALPGFGKGDLDTPQGRARLSAVLDPEPAA